MLVNKSLNIANQLYYIASEKYYFVTKLELSNSDYDDSKNIGSHDYRILLFVRGEKVSRFLQITS